jgi:hypothetical protein
MKIEYVCPATTCVIGASVGRPPAATSNDVRCAVHPWDEQVGPALIPALARTTSVVRCPAFVGGIRSP